MNELSYHLKQNLHARSSEDFDATSLRKTPSYIYKHVLIASKQIDWAKMSFTQWSRFFWISICVLKSSLFEYSRLSRTLFVLRRNWMFSSQVFKFSLRATHDFTLVKSKERNLNRNLSNPFTNVSCIRWVLCLFSC